MVAEFRPPVNYSLMTSVVVLTLATAIIHLLLGLPLFILNGIGYIVLLALLYAPISQLAPYQHYVRYVLIAYTGLTIILWIFLGIPYTGLGYITKLIELILIVVLAVEATRVRQSNPH